MKRILLTLCLTLLVLLIACDRYPGQRVDSARDVPGASIEGNQEATNDDELLDNPIPGTAVEGDIAAATSPSAEGVADPVNPGVNAADSSGTAVTSDAEAGGSETGGSEIGGSETGGAATEGSEVENAETGGAETGGAQTTAESRDAASAAAGDLDLIGQSSAALEDADVTQAVATIEAWQTRLEGLNNQDLAALNDDLGALKTELQADTPDENKVKALLYTLGQETSRLALAAPQEVGDALNVLGTTLSEVGEEGAVAAEPVDVGGAMPGVADTGGADAGTSDSAAVVETQAETDVSPPEEADALDMNLQTGTVERDDLGVAEASQAEPAQTTRETTTPAQTSEPAETGGASGQAETGGTNEQTAQENVTSSQAPELTEGELLASAQLQDAEGNDVGVVNLVSSNAGIVFEFGLTEGASLAAGEHGFHVHETGACEPDFEAAGAHLNPTGASHGLLNADGPHAGDLPNLVVPEDGRPTYVVTTTRLTQEDLFDDDGSAMMIHADPDDYVTDPGGNSGDRMACGVLERVEASR